MYFVLCQWGRWLMLCRPLMVWFIFRFVCDSPIARSCYVIQAFYSLSYCWYLGIFKFSFLSIWNKYYVSSIWYSIFLCCCIIWNVWYEGAYLIQHTLFICSLLWMSYKSWLHIVFAPLTGTDRSANYFSRYSLRVELTWCGIGGLWYVCCLFSSHFEISRFVTADNYLLVILCIERGA